MKFNKQPQGAVKEIQKILRDGLSDFSLLAATKGYSEDVQIMYVNKIITSLKKYIDVV